MIPALSFTNARMEKRGPGQGIQNPTAVFPRCSSFLFSCLTSLRPPHCSLRFTCNTQRHVYSATAPTSVLCFVTPSHPATNTLGTLVSSFPIFHSRSRSGALGTIQPAGRCPGRLQGQMRSSTRLVAFFGNTVAPTQGQSRRLQ
jgi:hypothetical protein